MKKQLNTIKINKYDKSSINIFETRKEHIKLMLTALLVYSLENEKEKIDKFLLNNDFLLKGDLEDIRNYQKTIKENLNFYEPNTHLDYLLSTTNLYLIWNFNTFEDPRHKKCRLQKQKAKLLITFCKKIFSSNNKYYNYCEFEKVSDLY